MTMTMTMTWICNHCQIRRRVRIPKHPVPRPAPRRERDPGTLVEPARGRVDGVHADEVGTQVRREQERARRVKEHLVRVRRVLAGGVGTGFWECVCECLEGGGVGAQGEFECREGGALTGRYISLISSLAM